MKRLVFLLLLPFIFSFTMCGKRKDPLPPLEFYPEKPKILSVEQVEDKFLVRWKPVKKFYDGRRIRDIKNLHYEILVNFGERKYKTKKPFFFDKETSKIGERRCYTVYAVYKSKRSDPSEPFCIITKEPIKETPVILNSFAGDGFVKFTFKPSKDFSIEVFRNGKLYRILPKGVEEFVDEDVVNGREYSYRFRFSLGYLKGRFTNIFKVIPEDRIPPEPPKNPVIVRKGKSCILLWEPSPSKDVVGYLIQRRGDEMVRKLGKVIYFFLKNCGKETYYIRAFDKSGNFSKRIKVKEELYEEGSSDNGK
ncbi:MAG: hypothetical protein ABGX27_01460 [Desulfurobacteriaceae bacterium]